MDSTGLISMGVVFVATAYAACTDIRRFRVSNRLTFPLFGVGILFHILTGGWEGLGVGLAGAAFGLLSLLPFYVGGGMGAGDVKLLAAVGAWLGLSLTFQVFIAACLAAGVYAIALLVINRGISETLVYMQVSIERLLSGRGRLEVGERVEEKTNRHDCHRRLIPFAAMIFFGICSIAIKTSSMNRS